MFASEFDDEVDEAESVTLQQYHREAMIQGYNFGFEVGAEHGEHHHGQERHGSRARQWWLL